MTSSEHLISSRALRVLVYGDFRSPHATEWVRGLRQSGVEVFELSSETAGSLEGAGALSRARSKVLVPGSGLARRLRETFGNGTRFQFIHTLMAVMRFRGRRKQLLRMIEETSPDVVQALRLPYEGLTALTSVRGVPVVVSTWGTDFVPQARLDPLMRYWIRRVLPAASGLHVDERADIQRAREFGLSDRVPTLFAAGNFGVEPSLFFPEDKENLVVFPRRVTPVSNYRTFLAAVNLLRDTDAEYVGIGLAGTEGTTQGAVPLLRVTDDLSRDKYAELIRRARVVVSLNDVDGSANSILEGIACGARLVVGRLPQYETMALQGFPIDLVSKDDPVEVAAAIRRALSQPPKMSPELPPEFSRTHNTRVVPGFLRDVVASYA